MKRQGRLILLPLFLLLVSVLYAPGIYSLTFPDESVDAGGEVRGDSAMAERYALWSKNQIDNGHWAEALSALERASDFAAVSSDISYLLALARSRANKPRGSVLEALEMALKVDLWNMYRAEDARLMKAENLIALRSYSGALRELSAVRISPAEAALRLKALVFLRPEEFRLAMTETLDRYPRETEPVRIFFSYLKASDATGHYPGAHDIQLLELIIRRIPVLLLKDPELAWIASPFMRDTDEAKRLVMAYRAANRPEPASLPAALKLGVIDEDTALEELFDIFNTRLDIGLLGEVWTLLRREGARTAFKRNLSVFSGVIIEDADGDGFPETSVEYRRGVPENSSYDLVQGGIPDLSIQFEAGNPRRASYLLPPEGSPSRRSAGILWERYPALEEVELDKARFIARPLSFYFAPVKFENLWGSGLLFPKLDLLNQPLTRRVLVSQSLRVERPSREFNGGFEVVELNQSIPVRAREFVGDLMVSETDFLRGRPQLQRVDLDFDGRMETFRFFKRNYRAMEPDELWDYDREFDKIETNEEWE